jgi:hypothetical protein
VRHEEPGEVDQAVHCRDRHDEHSPAADKDDENRVLALGHCQYRRRRHSGREGVYGRSIAHDLAEARGMARQTVNKEES